MTYHDSCHLLRGLGESGSPRALLRGVPGVELVELPGADECCGFGGSFSVRLPEVSSAILDKKLANVEATGARLPGGLRRGLPHADGRRPDPPRLGGAGGAPGPGAGRRGLAGERGRSCGPRFPERAGAALGDAFLQEALTIATTKFIDLRKESFAGFPAGEALRDRARAIKEATLQHLDVHLERLADNVERLGGHGALGRHRGGSARDRAAARARPRGADGGEVQVDGHRGDRPQRGPRGTRASRRWRPTWASTSSSSPTRSRRTSSPPRSTRPRGRWRSSSRASCGGRFEADPEVLTAVARRVLREKFLQADMGITGANFAVAETGTVVLVTNEGNGRMVTSLPRIHVALMGIEKVIPSMSDLVVFLAILARSATGQKLSSYTTLVRGPRRAGSSKGRRSST